MCTQSVEIWQAVADDGVSDWNLFSPTSGYGWRREEEEDRERVKWN